MNSQITDARSSATIVTAVEVLSAHSVQLSLELAHAHENISAVIVQCDSPENISAVIVQCDSPGTVSDLNSNTTADTGSINIYFQVNMNTASVTTQVDDVQPASLYLCTVFCLNIANQVINATVTVFNFSSFGDAPNSGNVPSTPDPPSVILNKGSDTVSVRWDYQRASSSIVLGFVLWARLKNGDIDQVFIGNATSVQLPQPHLYKTFFLQAFNSAGSSGVSAETQVPTSSETISAHEYLLSVFGILSIVFFSIILCVLCCKSKLRSAFVDCCCISCYICSSCCRRQRFPKQLEDWRALGRAVNNSDCQYASIQSSTADSSITTTTLYSHLQRIRGAIYRQHTRLLRSLLSKLFLSPATENNNTNIFHHQDICIDDIRLLSPGTASVTNGRFGTYAPAVLTTRVGNEENVLVKPISNTVDLLRELLILQLLSQPGHLNVSHFIGSFSLVRNFIIFFFSIKRSQRF